MRVMMGGGGKGKGKGERVFEHAIASCDTNTLFDHFQVTSTI